MKFRKADPADVARFGAALPAHPALQRRTMFGYPAAFVNGNYFAGLYEDRFVVRLPDALRDRFTELAEGEPFDPMRRGEPIKDWWVIPPGISDSEERLGAFLTDALTEVAKLPPKAAKPRRSRRRPSPAA